MHANDAINIIEKFRRHCMMIFLSLLNNFFFRLLKVLCLFHLSRGASARRSEPTDHSAD